MAAKAWFAFYNLSHKLTKTSFSLQVIDRPLLDHIHFHEQLEMGEDLKFILEARAHGNFFYFPTKEVFTSIRRFEKEGWLKVFFHWIFVAQLPHKLQRHFDYKVVR